MAEIFFVVNGSIGAGVELPALMVNGNVNLPTTPTVLLVSTAAPRTITLPAPATVPERYWYIKDRTGSAEANAITLDRTAGGDIDALTQNRELRSNFGKWMLYCDGTNWWIIA